MQVRTLSNLLEDGTLRASRAAVLFLVCLFAVAATVHAEGSNERSQSRTISVSGTGSVTARPDLAVVRLGVETRSGDVGKAIEAAAARTAAIEKALAGDGVASKDLATVDYNVGFVAANEGRAGVPVAGQGATAGGSSSVQAGYYRVTDVAAVTVRDLSHLGRVLDDALSAGANEVQGVTFRVADPLPFEKEARAMAFQDAHGKAEQIAALAGEKLGPMLRASVGGQPVQQAAGIYRAAAMAAPGISPGTLQVSAVLQVVYEIGGR